MAGLPKPKVPFWNAGGLSIFWNDVRFTSSRASTVRLKEGMSSNDRVFSKTYLSNGYAFRFAIQESIKFVHLDAVDIQSTASHTWTLVYADYVICWCYAAGETQHCLVHFAVPMWPAISQASHGPTRSSAQPSNELVAWRGGFRPGGGVIEAGQHGLAIGGMDLWWLLTAHEAFMVRGWCKSLGCHGGRHIALGDLLRRGAGQRLQNTGPPHRETSTCVANAELRQLDTEMM